MTFDFDSMPERHGMDSIAVDSIGLPGAPAGPKEGFSAIPMWVADMHFATCPTVTEAIARRLQHPLFGYFPLSDEYYASIIRWQSGRNGVAGLEPRHIGYENGVLGGVISTLNTLCSRGDTVLLQSPTYIGFTHALENNGYKIVLNPLIQDEQGVWRLDYEDMEKKIREHHIHATIFCSPHNPCGRVWEKEEILRAMLLNGHRHTPTQSVSDYARSHTAAFYAPSKTFNLAGLVGSYHIIYGDWLRDREMKEASLPEYNSVNVLSMHALIGAYRPEGAAWVDQLCRVLSDNVNYAYDFILSHFDGVTLRKPEGTYMLFLRCEEWCRRRGKTIDDLLKLGTDVGVAWQDGRLFNDPWGIRMNLALPRHMVAEAFDRLRKYVF